VRKVFEAREKKMAEVEARGREGEV